MKAMESKSTEQISFLGSQDFKMPVQAIDSMSDNCVWLLGMAEMFGQAHGFSQLRPPPKKKQQKKKKHLVE